MDKCAIFGPSILSSRLQMKKLLLGFAALTAALCCGPVARAQYYKDLFMDGGINITSRVDLPAARFLDLSWERYYSASHNPMELSLKDTVEQTALLVRSEIDQNGCLLYPDGAPRFRVLYVNGGKAGKHGESLTEEGRSHIREFVRNGGSYVGTCAGAFISSIADTRYDASKGRCVDADREKVRDVYFGVYPARTISTDHLTKDYLGEEVTTGMTLEPGSPLLRYFDFGGDLYIDSVRHNGGCFITTDPLHFAPGTEVLLRYDYDPAKERVREEEGRFKITGHISTWAHKASAESGRVVNCGSHPEAVVSGERLQLFAAMLLYAMDGNGAPRIKGELFNGEPRVMDRCTDDGDPDHARIGDKQYHHFTVNVPEGAKNVRIELRGGYAQDDLFLTLRKGDFAFAREASYADVTPGGIKTLQLDSLEAGLWYIGVKCDTTVDTVPTDYGTAYTGHLEVLNGVPYTLKVSWE